MVMYHAKRGAKQGRSGYVFWSILDGRAALRIPWRDLLADGRHDTAKLEMIHVACCEFERRLGEHTGGKDKLPPMPTANARVVELDMAAFYAELAPRVAEAKKREAARRERAAMEAQAARIASGANEIVKSYDTRRFPQP